MNTNKLVANDAGNGWAHVEKPNMSGLLAALKECGRARDSRTGADLHSQAVSSGLIANTSVVNSLISMYGKCGNMAEARSIFDRLERKSVVSWTALLQGYVDNDENELALEMFESMRKPAPNARTYLAALSACATLASKQKNGLRWLEKGRDIHLRAQEAQCCDIFVENRLIDMYAKCDSMVNARTVFNNMVNRTAVSWTSLLYGYVENGESELALELFDCMDQEDGASGCAPDSRTFVAALMACATLATEKRWNGRHERRWLEKGKTIHAKAAGNRCCDIYLESTLVDMYAKCGSMVLSRGVFDRMKKKNVVSWTALIMGYVENGESEVALELVDRMESSGVTRNARTYVAALMACGSLMAIETGERFHLEIIDRRLEHEVVVANSLVDFYGKCGSMETAKGVFDGIAHKTIVSWTALMCGYSLQGKTEQVFGVFERMREQGVRADEVTFVCILSACSHAGMTGRGRAYFETMTCEYGIKPTLKHYACMVDLLGRANYLDEALRVVRSMPFEADVLTWKAILGACRKWNNAAVARVAYEALLRLDEREASAYVMMANVYKEKGTLSWGKTLWICDTGKVHKFVSSQDV